MNLYYLYNGERYRERHAGGIHHDAYSGGLDGGCGVVLLFGIFSSVLKEAHFYKFSKNF